MLQSITNSSDFNEIFNLLLNIDETDRIEAKEYSFKLGASFLETVCAFSNEPDLGGGYILLGIKKNEKKDPIRYTIKGVSDPDDLQQQIASQCRQGLSIVVRPFIKVVAHPQGVVILVYIPEANSHDKPVYVLSKGMEKGAFRRIGPSNQLCTRVDLDLIYQYRSKLKYDESPVEQASLEDFDSKAILAYRNARREIKADAGELSYNDADLLKILKATTNVNSITYPTVAGLLLFGKEEALERVFSTCARIEYLLIEGIKWVPDPQKRYSGIMRFCEPLILALPRILNKIMNDLHTTFSIPDQVHRVDIPELPQVVVREALVNALMHRDYQHPTAIQIIKYANRLEFRNPGYSLKTHDELGLPGSVTRNFIITNVFRSIQFAETIGTGINAMRDEMISKNFSAPLIESVRESNRFVLTLLPHHLSDDKNRAWLEKYKPFDLSDKEARTLVVLREMGALTNADYRFLHGVDTLTASAHLRRLRDLGLLEQRGGGNGTYYVPVQKLIYPPVQAQSNTQESSPSIQLTPAIIDEGSQQPPLIVLPDDLNRSIKQLGKRSSYEQISTIIISICSIQPFSAYQIACFLNKSMRHVRDIYLTRMVSASELFLSYPGSVKHPMQTYRAKPNNDN